MAAGAAAATDADYVADWTHDQLEGFMGSWFVDRGWVPALAELDVGLVKGGGGLPRWAKDDDDYLDMMTRFYRMAEEDARKSLERTYDRTWIADVAGLVICSATRLKQMRLGHLLEHRRRQPPALAGYEVAPSYLTWLCEVKVARSDFLKDDKFDKPPQAHVQLLAVPKGLVGIDEIPRGWGLLEVKGKGGGVRKNMDRLLVNEIQHETEFNFVERMTWAMWWRHHNESLRNFQKKMGEERSAENDARKVSDIVCATVEFLTGSGGWTKAEGAGLVDHLRRRNVRRRPSEWAIELAEKARRRFQRGDTKG